MTKSVKKTEENTCRTCVHFKNQQMLLNYHDYLGFCVNPSFSFNTTNGRLIGVVDINNLRDRVKVSGNCAHDFETKGVMLPLKPSQYLLQVEEDFGCIKHNKK